MKVLMIEHFYPGNTYTYNLIHHLKDSVDLTLLTNKKTYPTEDGLTWENKIYAGKVSLGKSLFEYFRSLSEIRQIIKKGGFDVVHIQTFKKHQLEVPLYLHCKKYCKCFVHTVHNVLPHECSPAHFKLLRRLYLGCDALIVHNETSKNKLLEVFPEIDEKRVFVIPHGSYPIMSEAVPKASDETKKTFLMFGLVRKYKGIDLLLKAVSLLPKEVRDNSRFTIAGEQLTFFDATDYEQMIRDLNINDCVLFDKRRIRDDELGRLFGGTDFCVFPYREIYGSGALLMAYSYKKPVIVSDVETFKEESDGGRCGLLFESENAEGLSKAIIEAFYMDDELYGKCIENIGRLLAEKYDWKISAGSTLEVYKKITESN